MEKGKDKLFAINYCASDESFRRLCGYAWYINVKIWIRYETSCISAVSGDFYQLFRPLYILNVYVSELTSAIALNINYYFSPLPLFLGENKFHVFHLMSLIFYINDVWAYHLYYPWRHHQFCDVGVSYNKTLEGKPFNKQFDIIKIKLSYI